MFFHVSSNIQQWLFYSLKWGLAIQQLPFDPLTEKSLCSVRSDPQIKLTTFNLRLVGCCLLILNGIQIWTLFGPLQNLHLFHYNHISELFCTPNFTVQGMLMNMIIKFLKSLINTFIRTSSRTCFYFSLGFMKTLCRYVLQQSLPGTGTYTLRLHDIIIAYRSIPRNQWQTYFMCFTAMGWKIMQLYNLNIYARHFMSHFHVSLDQSLSANSVLQRGSVQYCQGINAQSHNHHTVPNHLNWSQGLKSYKEGKKAILETWHTHLPSHPFTHTQSKTKRQKLSQVW